MSVTEVQAWPKGLRVRVAVQRAVPLSSGHLPRAISDTFQGSPLHVLSALLLWVCADAKESGIGCFAKIGW